MAHPPSPSNSRDAQAPNPSPQGAPSSGPKVPAGQPAPGGGPPKSPEKYITTKEFRYRIFQAFGYLPDPSTVQRWLRLAKISAVRVGHLWLIPERAWEEFLAGAKQGDQF